VAADVGGVRNLMTHEKDGLIYSPGHVDALAGHIIRLFAMEETACTYGASAISHARTTHDPDKNLQDLIRIYNAIR